MDAPLKFVALCVARKPSTIFMQRTFKIFSRDLTELVGRDIKLQKNLFLSRNPKTYLFLNLPHSIPCEAQADSAQCRTGIHNIPVQVSAHKLTWLSDSKPCALKYGANCNSLLFSSFRRGRYYLIVPAEEEQIIQYRYENASVT